MLSTLTEATDDAERAAAWGARSVDALVGEPPAEALADEHHLGAAGEADAEAFFAGREAADAAHHVDGVPAPVDAHPRGAGAIAGLGLDGDAVPAGLGARAVPAGLDREAGLDLDQRALGDGERGAAVEDEQDRVALLDAADDVAAAARAQGDLADRADGRRLGRLGEDDLPVGGGDLDVEGVEAAGVVDGLALEVDERGGSAPGVAARRRSRISVNVDLDCSRGGAVRRVARAAPPPGRRRRCRSARARSSVDADQREEGVGVPGALGLGLLRGEELGDGGAGAGVVDVASRSSADEDARGCGCTARGARRPR